MLEYYEDNQDRYLQDEQRQARHILVLSGDDEDAAEAEAAALLARIQAGESFEALAAEHSDDGGTASRGGDLGVLTRSQLPGELGGAVFSMDAGQVDGPIKSDFGFHIVQLDVILEQGPLPLDQVRGELLTELRDREAEDAFRELERQVSDALFDAPDLEGDCGCYRARSADRLRDSRALAASRSVPTRPRSMLSSIHAFCTTVKFRKSSNSMPAARPSSR